MSNESISIGQPQLKKAVRASQFFAVAFGAIVGASWIVLLGLWLDKAGPLGAILAFIAGFIVIGCISLCYAELSTMLPLLGGEMAYANEIFGLRAAYFIGWILLLIYVAVVSYMCIAAVWILEFLFPAMQGRPLYQFHGSTVHLYSLLISLVGVLFITLLNYRGVKSATKVQDLLTYGKLAISVVFIAAGLFSGHVANLSPLFRKNPNESVAWSGMLSVFVMTLWFYGGFNNVPQLMEEKESETSLRTVGKTMFFSVGVAAAFYCLVILSSAMAVPWRTLISADLPAASAFRVAFHSEILVRAVLVAGLFGTFTCANSCFLAGTRVLLALARAGLVSTKFTSVHAATGSPITAVSFIGAISFGGVFLGRGGILPIVNVGATCFALAYLVTCLGVIRLRQTQPERPRPYRVLGGVFTACFAVLCSAIMLGISIYQPYLDAKRSAPPEWIILLLWGALGAGLWMVGRKQREASIRHMAVAESCDTK